MTYPIKNIACRQGHPIPEASYYPGENVFDPEILRGPEPVGHDGNYDPYDDYYQCEECGDLFGEEGHECLA